MEKTDKRNPINVMRSFLENRYPYIYILLITLTLINIAAAPNVLHNIANSVPRAIFITLLGVFVFFIDKRYLRNDPWKAIKIFALGFLLFEVCSFLFLHTELWEDNEGYYNLGLKAKEIGPVALLEDYSTLKTNWTQDRIDNVRKVAEGFGVWGYVRDRLILNVVDGGVITKNKDVFFTGKVLEYTHDSTDPYLERSARHGPVYPLILSIFLSFFGEARISIFLGMSIVGALMPLLLFKALRRLSNEIWVARLVILFTLTSPVLLNTSLNGCNIDFMLLIICCSALLALMKGIGNGSQSYIFIAGMVSVLGIFMKFTFLVVVMALLVLLTSKKNIRLLSGFLVGGIVTASIFILLGYDPIVNFVTSIALQEVALASNYLDVVGRFALLRFLIFYGAPILLLATIRLTGFEKNEDYYLYVIFLALIILTALYLGTTLNRLMIPMIPILLVGLVKEPLLENYRFFRLSLVAVLILDVMLEVSIGHY